MNEIRTGRSLAKPARVVRSRTVLEGFAALHAGRMCEWCVAEDLEGETRPWGNGRFEEIHHLLGGARRADQDWNLVGICAAHHRHDVHGYHGSRPLWTPARAFALKLSQGYELPADAWGYLPEGRDACPNGEPVQARNRFVTARVCDELRRL